MSSRDHRIKREWGQSARDGGESVSPSCGASRLVNELNSRRLEFQKLRPLPPPGPKTSRGRGSPQIVHSRRPVDWSQFDWSTVRGAPDRPIARLPAFGQFPRTSWSHGLGASRWDSGRRFEAAPGRFLRTMLELPDHIANVIPPVVGYGIAILLASSSGYSRPGSYTTIALISWVRRGRRRPQSLRRLRWRRRHQRIPEMPMRAGSMLPVSRIAAGGVAGERRASMSEHQNRGRVRLHSPSARRRQSRNHGLPWFRVEESARLAGSRLRARGRRHREQPMEYNPEKPGHPGVRTGVIEVHRTRRGNRFGYAPRDRRVPQSDRTPELASLLRRSSCAENTVTPTLNGPGRYGASIFVFDAVAIWVACALSMPAAVRFVKTSTNAHADAKAILKPMAAIGSLRSEAGGVIGSGSRRERSGETTSSQQIGENL